MNIVVYLSLYASHVNFFLSLKMYVNEFIAFINKKNNQVLKIN